MRQYPLVLLVTLIIFVIADRTFVLHHVFENCELGLVATGFDTLQTAACTAAGATRVAQPFRQLLGLPE